MLEHGFGQLPSRSVMVVAWRMRAANPSERGLRESAGLMVNYSYELGAVDANHSRHVATGDVIASEEVVGLCGAAPSKL